MVLPLRMTDALHSPGSRSCLFRAKDRRGNVGIMISCYNPMMFMCRLYLVRCLLAAAVVFTPVLVRAQVFLNEIGAANSGAVLSPGGTSPDYIELYNTNTAAVSLTGWTLTDDVTVSNKYAFPAGTTIPGRGFLIVWLDSTTNYAGLVTTNFTLKSSGEEAGLYQGATRRDYVKFGPQVKNMPISRIPNGTGAWNLSQPSPLATNTAVVAGTFGTNIALRLNEWLATNSAGVNMDWLELYNPGTNGIVSLGGLVISDMVAGPSSNVTTAAVIPNSYIGSGEFLRLWCDTSTNRGDHLDIKLSSTSGETLTVYQPNRTGIIDRVTFGPQTRDTSMGRLPDGSTNIFSFAGTNSMSPGLRNLWQPLASVLVNEVLTHTDPPLEDAIELYNPTAAPVDISNWYLSNSEEFPLKFRVPTNTILPAGGYKVFYEQSQPNGASSTPGFNRSGAGNTPDFTLNSAHGDFVVITEGQASGAVTGRRTTRAFGSSANGVSFGRYVKSDGGTDLVPMSARTFGVDNPATVTQFRGGNGLPNAYPLIGPLILTEIMYRPPDTVVGTVTNDNTLDEFIELTSVTNAALPLYDPAYPTNTWQIIGDITYKFPTNQTVATNGRVLLVSFNPLTNAAQLAAFRAKYSVAPAVPVFGPYSPSLSNRLASIQLEKPDPVQLPPHPDAGFVPYVLVEKVKYENTNGWPASADGTGLSLHRRSLTGYANDHTNWFGAAPTAGAPDAAGTPPSITTPHASQYVPVGSNVTFTVGATGTPVLAYQWQRNLTNLPGETASMLSRLNAQTNQSGLYAIIVTNQFGAITSAPVTLSVAGPPRMRFLQRASSGAVEMDLLGLAGHVYEVEATTDIASTNWTLIRSFTFTNTLGSQLISDPAATNLATRFYRGKVVQ